jgi:hypothetical protein
MPTLPSGIPGEETLDPEAQLNIPEDLEVLAEPAIDETEPGDSPETNPLEEEEGLGVEEPAEADLEEIEVEEEEETDLLEWGAELGDDPVRMYLKEISQVRLLDPDQEIWLATQMSAAERLVALKTLLSARLKHQPKPDEIVLESYQNFLNAWDEVQKSCRKTHVKAPNLALLIREAQALRQGTPLDLESNLRPFLNSDHHDGKTKAVPSTLLGVLFETYVSLYLLPPEVLGHLADQVAPPRKKSARATSKASKAIETARRMVSRKGRLPTVNALSKALPERTPRATSSARMPRGGFARPSRAPSPTRRAPSASPSTWSRRSIACCASSAT